MYRYFFRFVVMTITILTANLLTTRISSYLISYRSHVRPLTFTLIAMAIIVLVFYPLYAKLEVWAKGLSIKIVREGKSLAGKYLGLALAFFACLTVLCYFYAKIWYHIDLFRIIMKGEVGNYL